MDMRPATGAETPEFTTNDLAQSDNMSRRNPNTATQLRDLYRRDDIARALFDDAAKRRVRCGENLGRPYCADHRHNARKGD